MSFCPNCGHPVDVRPTPVEPLYGAMNAAMMVPCTVAQLQLATQRHPDLVGPPLYIWHKRRRHRMYRASDIRALRDYFVTPEWRPWTKRRKETHERKRQAEAERLGTSGAPGAVEPPGDEGDGVSGP